MRKTVLARDQNFQLLVADESSSPALQFTKLSLGPSKADKHLLMACSKRWWEVGISEWRQRRNAELFRSIARFHVCLSRDSGLSSLKNCAIKIIIPWRIMSVNCETGTGRTEIEEQSQSEIQRQYVSERVKLWRIGWKMRQYKREEDWKNLNREKKKN